ncbi:MAG: hypothetical protein U0Q22_19515 [Acidimicrobiales bacterium]
MAEIDDRVGVIDRELGWIDAALDRGDGDPQHLLAQREQLMSERDRLTHIRELLGPDPDPSTGSPVTLDPSDDGCMAVTIGDPSKASDVVVHVSSPDADWDRVVGKDRLGDPGAWKIADAANAGPGHDKVAVVSSFDRGGDGLAPPGSPENATPEQRVGARLADTVTKAGGGRPAAMVIDDSSVPSVREALRLGAPVDRVAVVGGSPESIRDLSSHGVSARAVDHHGRAASPAPSTSTSEDDPFEQLLDWIRHAIRGS